MNSRNDCIVTEKPSDVSFDEIHQVLWEANAANRSKGFVLNTSKYSGQKLAEKIGEDGKCFVATSNGRIVGTSSVRIVERNKWYMKGKIPDLMLAAVIPEYQGKGVLTMLVNEVLKFSTENNFNAVELDTAEDNTHAIGVYHHLGFELVDYKKIQNTDHFSVVMVRWMADKPYNDMKRRIMYAYRRLATRSKYRLKKVVMRNN